MGPKNETHWAGIAWEEVEAGCGVSFVCLITANILLVTARWTAIKPTLVLMLTTALTVTLPGALEGDSIVL